MIMDIKQLTCFVSVFEHANLSHAAGHLSMAQSAVSHHIGNLESQIGAPLFVRMPRGMKPTAAGQRLYQHAHSILLKIKSAEQDMLRNAVEIAGEISVGLPYSVIQGIGVPLMKAIPELYPKVHLSIIEGLSDNTHTSLLSSEVDLALFYNPQKDRRITVEPVLTEEVFCIGKTSIISESDAPITFDELATLPLLLLRHGASSRAVIDRPTLLNQLAVNVPLKLNSVSGITSGLKSGLGCTLAPNIFVRDLLRDGTLHARPVVKPKLSRRLYLGYRRDYPSNRLFEALRVLILELISQEVYNGNWEAILESDSKAKERL